MTTYHRQEQPVTDAPPQYHLTVTIGGETITDAEPLDDPFVRTTITIDPRDLADHVLTKPGEPLVVVVRVDGTRAALAHVFARPIDLTPNEDLPTSSAVATEARP